MKPWDMNYIDRVRELDRLMGATREALEGAWNCISNLETERDALRDELREEREERDRLRDLLEEA